MKNGDINFDKFRKDRRHRRAQFGGVPATEARNGLRDAEAYEERQVHETRLTRDVHEFLAQATRQAAQIVEKVTHAAEQESSQRLTKEVQEFLQETVRRAASFLRLVQAGAFGTATQDVETHVSNLLGQALDSFRFEGTAQIADKHIGQNPFHDSTSEEEVEDEASDDGESIDLSPPTAKAAAPAPAPVAAPAPAPVAAAPAAPAAPAAAAKPAPAPVGGIPSLDKLLGGDVETLKKALKALVKAGVMSQDQAREIYRADLAARSS